MKKTLKITVSFLLIMAMIISLSSCGEIEKAENTVNGMFSALKEADAEKVSEYMSLDDFKTDNEDESSITSNAEMLIKNMFSKLDYKIVSSQKTDETTVVVTAEITNTDMKPVITEFFANALQYAFANAFADPQPSEEETSKKMEEMFIESINKPERATITNIADITVVKVDKTWRIKTDDAFLNALMGGLYEAIEEIENSFNSDE